MAYNPYLDDDEVIPPNRIQSQGQKIRYENPYFSGAESSPVKNRAYEVFKSPLEKPGQGGIDDAFARGVGMLQQSVGATRMSLGLGGEEQIIAGSKRISENPRSREEEAAMREFQQSEGFIESARNLFTNPGLLVDISAESIAASVPSLVLGGAGTIAGAAAGPAGSAIGATVGGASGAAIGSFATEYGLTLLEVMERNGVDIDDPNALKAAFDNPRLLNEAKLEGVKRGIPIAVWDGFSMGVAGKVGARIFRGLAKEGASTGRKVAAGTAAGVAETGLQGAYGGAGEASAQLATEGRITSAPDIVAEAAGEVVPGVVETGIGVARDSYAREQAGRIPQVPPPTRENPRLEAPLDTEPGGPPEPGRTGRTGLEEDPRRPYGRRLEDRSRDISVGPEGTAYTREEALRRDLTPSDQTIRVTPSGTAVLPDQPMRTPSGVVYEPENAPERTARQENQGEIDYTVNMQVGDNALRAGRARMQGPLADQIEAEQQAEERRQANLTPEAERVLGTRQRYLVDKINAAERKKDALRRQIDDLAVQQASAKGSKKGAITRQIGKLETQIQTLDEQQGNDFEKLVDVRDQLGRDPNDFSDLPLALPAPDSIKMGMEQTEQTSPLGTERSAPPVIEDVQSTTAESTQQSAVTNLDDVRQWRQTLQTMERAEAQELDADLSNIEYLSESFPDAAPEGLIGRLRVARNQKNISDTVDMVQEIAYEWEQNTGLDTAEIYGGLAGPDKIRSSREGLGYKTRDKTWTQVLSESSSVPLPPTDNPVLDSAVTLWRQLYQGLSDPATRGTRNSQLRQQVAKVKDLLWDYVAANRQAPQSLVGETALNIATAFNAMPVYTKPQALVRDAIVALTNDDPNAALVNIDQMELLLEADPTYWDMIYTKIDPLESARTQSVLDGNPQTETQQFKNWFKNSKVVDRRGQPLVVFHSTDADFNVFKNPSEPGGRVLPRTAGGDIVGNRGMFFFTPDTEIANDYTKDNWTKALSRFNASTSPQELGDFASGANVIPVYLSLQKPKVIDAKGRGWRIANEEAAKAYDSGKYDGVIIKNVSDSFTGEVRRPTDVYIAFNSKQIKSAIGNSGEFNALNPDIRRTVTLETTAKKPLNPNVIHQIGAMSTRVIGRMWRGMNVPFTFGAGPANLKLKSKINGINKKHLRRGSVSLLPGSTSNMLVWTDGNDKLAMPGVKPPNAQEMNFLSNMLGLSTEVWNTTLGYDPFVDFNGFTTHTFNQYGDMAVLSSFSAEGASVLSVNQKYFTKPQGAFLFAINHEAVHKVDDRLIKGMSEEQVLDLVKQNVDRYKDNRFNEPDQYRLNELNKKVEYAGGYSSVAAIDPALDISFGFLTGGKTQTGDIVIDSIDLNSFGPVAKEIVGEFIRTTREEQGGTNVGKNIARMFGYPLELFFLEATDKNPDLSMLGMIQSEIFAQLGSLYISDPQTLQRQLPTSYEYIRDKLAQAKDRYGSDETTSPQQQSLDLVGTLQRSFREAATVVGNADVRPDGRRETTARRSGQGPTARSTRSGSQDQVKRTPPPSLKNARKEITGKIFKTGRDLKLRLQEIARSHLASRGLSHNDTESEKMFRYLVNSITADVTEALKSNSNAVGWYNQKVSQALSVLSLVHPEINTDQDARFAFIWALAVTSNGQRVNKNFELAEAAYKAFKKTGRMPTNVGVGNSADQINEGLALFNTLSEKLGMAELRRVMTSKMTVREVNKLTGKKVSGELMNEVVYGAAVLGPKVGNGFFMNLYGEFGQLTMDRWFVRTWERHHGRLVEPNVNGVNKAVDDLRRLLAVTHKDKAAALSEIVGVEITDNMTDAQILRLGKAINKASIKADTREQMNSVGRGKEYSDALLAEFGPLPRGKTHVGIGDTFRKIGNRLAKHADGQKESPQPESERGRMRRVFSEVLKKVSKTHPDMTMADLQALLWYAEKRLYDSAKTEEVTHGYEEDSAPDYANAAALVARRGGIREADIQSALKSPVPVSAGGTRRGNAARSGSEEVRPEGLKVRSIRSDDERITTPGIDLKKGRRPGESISDYYRRRQSEFLTEAGQTELNPLGHMFSRTDITWRDWFIQKFQDKLIRLKRWEQAVATQRGANVLPEWQSAYRAEERMHGKAREDMDALERDYVDPMVKELVNGDLTLDELGLYVYAKHATERNTEIAKINPEMPDGGSGLTNAQAAQILAEFQKQGLTDKAEAAAKHLYDMLEASRQRMEDFGLEDWQVIQAWNKKYKNYVPLKGIAEDEVVPHDEGRIRLGKGLSVGGRESLRALGRKLRAANPVVTSVRDATEKVIRARKNEVAKKFYNFVRANPNPKLWKVLDKKDVERYFNDRANEVRYRTKNPMMMKMTGQDLFEVKINGETKYIEIKDPILLDALLNVGEERVDAMGRLVLNTFGRVTQWMAAFNTRWNPVWTVLNAPRDFTAGILNLMAEQDHVNGLIRGQDIAGKVAKEVTSIHKGGLPPPHRAFWRHLHGKNGTTPAEIEYDKYAKEFMLDGGATGWVRLRSMKQQQKHIESMMRLDASKAGRIKPVQYLKRFKLLLEHFNDMVENGFRLSVYTQARKAGVSRERAASLAKNVTINFNRKGEFSTVLNSFYMFWNAAIQGSAQMIRTLSSRKARRAMYAIAGAHAMLTFANMLSMDADDEDYDQIPEYLKSRSMVAYVGGRLYIIPLPYGYSIFSYGATKITEAIAGRETASDALVSVTGKIIDDILPIRFPEGEYRLARGVTFTAAQPVADLMSNQNYFGNKIYRESIGSVKTPDSSMATKDASAPSKFLAEFLNSGLGDGSEKVSGQRFGISTDISPDSIDYVVSFFFGGAARTTFSTVNWLSDPELLAAPGVSKLITNLDTRTSSRLYYDRLEKLLQIDAQFRDLKGHERLEYRQKHDKEIKMALVAKATESRLRKLRTLLNKVEESDLDEEVKGIRAEKINEQIGKAYDDFATRYRKIMHAKGE